MKTKIIPFDLETAKKIQAGEIEGKIKQKHGEDVEILCWDLDEPNQLAVKHRYYERDEDLGIHVDEYNINGEFYDRSDCLINNDLVLELPDNEPQEELKQNFETVAESDAYWEGYKNGFEAGRCVASDDNKCMTLKANEPQFKPFDKVLVRDYDECLWNADFYSHFSDGLYRCVSCGWRQCIPYEGNQELVGTTKTPKDYGGK